MTPPPGLPLLLEISLQGGYQMRVGPGLLNMEGLDAIKTQAREEWTGTHIQPKFTPMAGQLGMSYGAGLQPQHSQDF